MTISAALTVMLLAGGGAPAHPLTGLWSWGGGERAGGTLATIDEQDGTRFQLQLSRGAPSYNMGFLEGRLSVKDGRATYRDGVQCEITFVFERERVVLEQTVGGDADCGFGHGVSADGTYRRISRKKPKFDLLPQ